MKYLIANWKMNHTIRIGEEFLREFSLLDVNHRSTQVIIAPSFTSLNRLSSLIQRENMPIYLAAQNMSQFESGAYTGEISAEMIKESGCRYVILGHSERRYQFHESEEVIFQKYKSAMDNSLIPILCFGETLPVYQAKETISFIKNQLTLFQKDKPFLFAYEPVWAIGTGLIPRIDEIVMVADFIKHTFPDSLLLYGGSVNPETIVPISAIPNLDGFLVGGASLKASTFFSLLLAMENSHESR